MSTELNMDEMINVMTAISQYKKLFHNFQYLTYPKAQQHGSLVSAWEEIPELKEHWNNHVIKDKSDEQAKWMAEIRWNEPNLHIITQTWGNTSGGWQGMGGSAMTSRYTTIIENTSHKFVVVYYSGKIAYILEMDDELIKYRDKGYQNLPGVEDLKSQRRNKLKALYINPR